MLKMDKLKLKIIWQYLEFQETRSETLRQAILSDLTVLASKYHLKIKRTRIADKKTALLQFCKFEVGAEKCINDLYSIV
jgi:hypothetical protein